MTQRPQQAQRKKVTKPVTSKAVRTKTALQQAATDVFKEHGWHGATVKQIVQTANVSHGTFYTYYPNRQTLLIELIETSVQPFLELVDQPWKGDTHHQALAAIVQNFFDIYHNHAAIMDVWKEAATLEPDIAQTYEDLRNRFVTRIENRFSTLIRLVRTEPPTAIRPVVDALMSMVEQYANQVSLTQSDRQEAIDALIFIWAGTINQLVEEEFITLPKN